MAAAYLFVHLRISNEEQYGKYRTAVVPLIAELGESMWVGVVLSNCSRDRPMAGASPFSSFRHSRPFTHFGPRRSILR